MKAFVSVLATDNYLHGILVLYQSLKDVQSNFPFHVAVTENLSSYTYDILKSYNIPTVNVQRRDSPKMPPFNKWRASYTKLEIFKLVQYEKIVYLDADMIILHNIDHLFDSPHMSAVASGCWSKHVSKFNFNSGLLVIVPSLDIYDKLVDLSLIHGDTCCGDQDVMQKYFVDWKTQNHLHLDHAYNIFVSHVGYTKNKYYFFESIEGKKPIYIVHYICPKPWDAKDVHLIPKNAEFLYEKWHETLEKCIQT